MLTKVRYVFSELGSSGAVQSKPQELLYKMHCVLPKKEQKPQGPRYKHQIQKYKGCLRDQKLGHLIFLLCCILGFASI